MSGPLICPQGHRWQPVEEDSGATTAMRLACPVCGAAPLPARPEPEAIHFAETLAPRTVPPPASDPSAPLVHGYEILGELGRGGMGVVYRARQLALNRIVALKMILAGGHAGPQDLERFRIEAEAVARLQHPNIVQIHEVGERNALPFFSLEYVNGGSLAHRLDGTPWQASRAAELLETLARAMHYAHRRGIVHRDLKPANILLQGAPTNDDKENTDRETPPPVSSVAACSPKITDFGLAKQLDSTRGQTQTGAILGTPSYMAPEQADGRRAAIGPATDVYALGAILYELLTGRPPFKAATPLDTILQVISTEPVPPTRLQPKVPRDLETICLRCLQKEPPRRYASAEELADDLHRFRAGEPIYARPTPTWERAVKWARRRPAVAALSGLSLLVALLGFGLVTWQWREAAFERHNAVLARDQEAEQHRQAEEALRESRQSLYFNQIALAQREWFANNPSRAEQLLEACPEELRRWEWHYLKRLGQTALLTLPAGSGPAVYSPDGKQLALTGADLAVEIWDPATRQRLQRFVGPAEPVSSLAFSPDGRRVAAGSADNRASRGGLYVWDVPTGRQLLALSSPTGSLAFSRDGQQIASGGGDRVGMRPTTVSVREVETGKELRTLHGPLGFVGGLAYSPDGKLLAAGGFSYRLHKAEVLTWEAETGKELPPFEGQEYGVTHLTFSPDSTRLATSSTDGLIRVWDVASRRLLLPVQLHVGEATAVQFSPDGQRIASCGADRTVRLRDAANGREVLTLRGHSGALTSVAFHPDGKRLAVAVLHLGAAGEVKVWDATTRQDALVLPGHLGAVLSVAQSPDGCQVASAGYDGVIRVSDIAERKDRLTVRGPPGQGNSVAFSPDGGRIAARGPDQALTLWEVRTGKVVQRLPGTIGPLSRITFSSDGKLLATESGEAFATLPGEIKVWELASGKVLLTRKGRGLAFRPDGRRLAWCAENNAIQLTDLETRQEVGELKGHTALVLGLAFSPDGRRLASAGWDQTVRLWNVEQGELLRTLSGHTAPIWSVAFTPDGGRLASASLGLPGKGEIKLWDPETGRDTLTLDGNAGVAFSADGKRLAGLNADLFLSSPVIVWDAGASGSR